MSEKNIFKKIDPLLYRFDDERVRLFTINEMTQLEFMRLASFDDPWEFRGNELSVITPEIQKKRIEDFKRQMKKGLENTGGLNGTMVHTHHKEFLKVYPEIKELLNKALKEIEKEDCKGCAMNNKMHPVVQKILEITNKDRKIELIPKLDNLIKTRLKGEKVIVPENRLKIPGGINKKKIPLLPDGVEHKKEVKKDEEVKKSEIVELDLKQQIVGDNIPRYVSDFNRALNTMTDSFHSLLNGVSNSTIEVKENTKSQQKLILENMQSPGDILMLTAAVRDLKLAHRDKYLIDVRTPCSALWENNPYLTKIDDNDSEALRIKMEYPIIQNSNEGAYHFIHGFRLFLEDKLDIKIPMGKMKGDIHLSDTEKSGWISQIEMVTGKDQPYWVIAAGGKTDFTCKLWDHDRYQRVVDKMTRMGILCVQIGVTGEGHIQKPLKGVVNLLDKTNVRELVRLIYHSSGVICPVTFPMVLAATIETRPDRCMKNRPCIVIAGGREPVQWQSYPHHAFLHTLGKLPCCDNGSCWKSRVVPIGDGDLKDTENLCINPVRLKNNISIPKCMDMIKVSDVIRHVTEYEQGFKLWQLDNNR